MTDKKPKLKIPSQYVLRGWKTYLNKYHHFSFKTPKKGKDFTRAQAVAIVKKFQELEQPIRDILHGKSSWIPTHRLIKNKKLKKSDIKNIALDSIVTNKGLIYKYPNAHLKNVKQENGKKKLEIIADTIGQDGKKVYYERVFIIPNEVKNSINNLIDFIDRLILTYSPDGIMITSKGIRYAQGFDREAMFLYESEKSYDGFVNTNDREYEFGDDIDEGYATVKDILLGKRDKYFYYAVILQFTTGKQFTLKPLKTLPDSHKWRANFQRKVPKLR